jgi:probable rRNA maturation factor
LEQIDLFNESGLDIPLLESDFLEMAKLVSIGESRYFSLLELVYVDEKTIVEVNKKYLNRDYVTDIITFPYSDSESDLTSQEIEGTIYMCNQRIREQADELSLPITEEFRRVYIHGLLHLCGYNDDNSESKMKMTAKENYYLLNFKVNEK